MKTAIRIIAPRRWTKNYIVNALLEDGLPNSYFIDRLHEDIEVLVTNSLNVDELGRLPNLKHLIIPTGGVEIICLDAVNDRKIKVYHNPTITSRGVAEYVSDNLRKMFQKQFKSFMSNATIGFLGFGNIGQQIYRTLNPFGGTFHAFVRSTDQQGPVKLKRGKEGLNEIIHKSDILINTLPRTKRTDHLLYEKTYEFKKESVIVSVSRSGIIDDIEVLDRVILGNLGGAILDVFSPKIDESLYHHPRIILTPHIAGIYGNSLQEMVQFIKSSIIKASKG